MSYDAASGTTLLYQNGTVVASLSSSIGQPMNIDQFQMISSGEEYFPDFCEMCQVRFWKVTRTVNQIRNLCIPKLTIQTRICCCICQ